MKEDVEGGTEMTQIKRTLNKSEMDGHMYYVGTEIVPTEKIMEITGGKSLEINLKSRDVKVVVNLHVKDKITFSASVHVEETEYRTECE